MEASKGPIPVFTREERWRFQRRVAVGLSFQRGGGEKLFAPSEVLLLLLKGEHRRDKPRGGLAAVRRARSARAGGSGLASRFFLLPASAGTVDQDGNGRLHGAEYLRAITFHVAGVGRPGAHVRQEQARPREGQGTHHQKQNRQPQGASRISRSGPCAWIDTHGPDGQRSFLSRYTQTLGSGSCVCSRKSVFSAYCGGCCKTTVHVRDSFVSHSSLHHVKERCPFADFGILFDLGQ